MINLFRDWLPAIGVVIAALWVVFKWLYDQRLRARSEMPSLTGSLHIDIHPLEHPKVLVAISSDWNSNSPMALYIDTQTTRIDIHEVSAAIPIGPLSTRSDLGEPIFRSFPIKAMSTFIFEPKTGGEIRDHFVLEVNKLYIARMKVYRDKARHGKKTGAWTREAIVDLREQ